MHTVARSHGHRRHTVGNCHTTKGARERLFVIMRVRQHARRQHRAVDANHFPSVGIVRPPAIVMGHGNVKSVAAIGATLDRNLDHVGLTG